MTEDAPLHIHEVLTNDPNAFKQVEVDDDGCGDGRPWTRIIQKYIDQDGSKKIRLFGTSKLRAKVFGGGLVVAASMWRTIKGAVDGNQTVGQDRILMASKLAEHQFSHGAHSDDHAEGGNCGCGAIDKYPLITANAVKYRRQIIDTLRVIHGDEFVDHEPEITQTLDTYEALAKNEGYFADATGKESMEQILESGAVDKELAGHHIEETIVINDAEGTTLDQQYFTETVKNACGGEKPRIIQAFSVDIWRGRQIADKVTVISQEDDPTINPDHIWKLAYADFLVRTLAVASTLTAGDLPVYRRRLATQAA